MIRRRWRVKRDGASLRLNLDPEERELLRSLLAQLRIVLGEDTDPTDERVRRLFPTAYPDDPEHDAEYHRFMREELVASHLAAIERFETTLDATRIAEHEAVSWAQALNSVRLVLGTLLDITEDMDLDDLSPDYPAYGSHLVYHYLSGLLDELIRALSD